MAYFPNATAGEVLDAQCEDCPLGRGWNDPDQQQLFDNGHDMRPCPVAFVQLSANYEQIRPSSATHAADYLERIDKGTFLPEEYNDAPPGQDTLKPAIKWLRSDEFMHAMNLLINEKGICQVREQLREIRRDQERDFDDGI